MFNYFIFLSLFLWVSTVSANIQQCEGEFSSPTNWMSFQEAQTFVQNEEVGSSNAFDYFKSPIPGISYLNIPLRKDGSEYPHPYNGRTRKSYLKSPYLGLIRGEKSPEDFEFLMEIWKDDKKAMSAFQEAEQDAKKRIARIIESYVEDMGSIYIDPYLFFEWFNKNKKAIDRGELNLRDAFNNLAKFTQERKEGIKNINAFDYFNNPIPGISYLKIPLRKDGSEYPHPYDGRTRESYLRDPYLGLIRSEKSPEDFEFLMEIWKNDKKAMSAFQEAEQEVIARIIQSDMEGIIYMDDPALFFEWFNKNKNAELVDALRDAFNNLPKQSMKKQ